MDVSFSERLRNIKALRRMTVKEIALELGMSERMYGYYESGDSLGDPKKIKKYLPNLERLENGDLHKKAQVKKGEEDIISLLYELIEEKDKRLNQYENTLEIYNQQLEAYKVTRILTSVRKNKK